ncbi:hypothetical protein [Nocardiopsis composta]|uniref:Type I restriction enzyme R protein N-terminal domain-containing protein n=1 Tax=Nocardiopsis composta TaxID=157465 RepID=A0A7W8QRZ8_9ACTN|nr:hypothetical protein [Nocardiopsis composta]MBB5435029.1 hypothetical protein [Nocardiopsis composta]
MEHETTQVMSRTGEFSTTLGWEASTRNRLAAAIDRFSGPLADLVERDANDGDTRLLVTDFLSYGLNFSKYEELTTEYRTSGDSIDYALRLDGKLFAPIEVKRVGQTLDARNLQQARRLALDEGAEWLILTNGRVWQVYHLRPDPDGGNPSTVRIIDVDLMAEGQEALVGNVDALFHITHEAIEHGRLDDLRKWREAVEPGPLAEVLQSEPVVRALRHELRRITGHAGHIGDDGEILRTLAEQIIGRRGAPS